MSRVLEKSIIEKRLREIGWEYISPKLKLIHEGHNLVFKNKKGVRYQYGFEEIWNWLYNPDYPSCIHNCDECLTPTC